MKKLNEIIYNHKAVFLGISILLIVAIIGVSFAIFRGKLRVVNQSETIVKSVRLGLIYTGIEEIKSDSMVSGDSFKKKFKVENKSDNLAYYNVFIENTTNTFIKNELIYNLKSDKGIDFDGVMPVTKDGKTYLRVGIPIEGGETQHFELTVTYKYLEDVDQSYNDNATFRGTLGIDTLKYQVTNDIDQKAILANISDDNLVETTSMTVSNETDVEIFYNIMLKEVVEDPQNYKDVYYQLDKDGKIIKQEKNVETKDYKLLENEVLKPGESTEYIIDFDKSTVTPELITSSSTYKAITTEYTTGKAKSGIKNTVCYLTDAKGKVISEGTLNNDNCSFDIEPTKRETDFNFKKCLISNENTEVCSSVSKIKSVGYCESGNFTTSEKYERIGSKSSCSNACGGTTTQDALVTISDISIFDNLICDVRTRTEPKYYEDACGGTKLASSEEKYVYVDEYGTRSTSPKNAEYKSKCNATVYRSTLDNSVCSKTTKYCNSKNECLTVNADSCSVATLRDANGIVGHNYMDLNGYFYDSNITGTCNDCYHTYNLRNINGWSGTYYRNSSTGRVYEWGFGANSTCHALKSNHPNC